MNNKILSIIKITFLTIIFSILFSPKIAFALEKREYIFNIQGTFHSACVQEEIFVDFQGDDGASLWRLGYQTNCASDHPFKGETGGPISEELTKSKGVQICLQQKTASGKNIGEKQCEIYPLPQNWTEKTQLEFTFERKEITNVSPEIANEKPSEEPSAGDLAEYMHSEYSLEAGDIVSFNPTREDSIRRTEKPYDLGISGIISNNPSVLLNQLVPGQTLDSFFAMASIGKVLTKVSAVNGPITVGDPITSSEIPGVGMKATKVGPIVGKALGPYDNPDPNAVGKILVFINVSWYGPDVYLTDAGELSIEEVVAEEGKKEFVLKNSAGEVIDRVGAFAKAAIANLRVGSLRATQIITDTLSSTQIITDKLISPLVETGIISPLPDSSDITIQLGNKEATESSFGKLLVQNKQGETVASIDEAGNATFAGEISANQASISGDLRAKRIFAEEIVGLQSKFGELITATISAEQIQGLEERLAQLEAEKSATPSPSPGPSPSPSPSPSPTLTPSPEPTPPATESGDPMDDIELSLDIEALVDEILNTSVEATPQADLTNIKGEDIKIANSLTVLGTTSLADTTIAGYLNVGGMMALSDDSINSLSGTLYLQNLGLGGIDILAGKIVIDEQGNMTIEGDLAVKGSLFANIIKPLEEQDLVIDLKRKEIDEAEETEEQVESKFGKLLVKGIDDKIVASIDASGSAFFASLGIEADYSATESGAIIAAYDNYLESGSYVPAIETNASAGIGILPTGKAEIQIYNPHISENTLIYVVPTSNTENKVLYLKAKKAQKDAEIDEEGNEIAPEEKGWFTVAIDKSIKQDIQFNWWIIGGQQ